MNKTSVIAIAEGLKQIEDGVEKIQRVMREENIKSIKEVAAELIPMLKPTMMKLMNPSSSIWKSVINPP